jgi:hypothetical protein
VRGKAKDKLNTFLVYFQRYLLAKETVPLHVEFMILDCLDLLEELAVEAAKESGGAVPAAVFQRYDSMPAVMEVIAALEAKSEVSLCLST